MVKRRDEAEIQLPLDLIATLKKQKIMATIATFSEDGLPQSSPINLLYPKGMSSILMAVEKDHESYINMVWRKKVILLFMDVNNMVYSILGRVGVIKAPSAIHPEIHIVRFDVIKVTNERLPLIKIDGHVRWEYKTPDDKHLGLYLMDELREIAEVI